MSRKTDDRDTTEIYRRLLVYARPYKARLAIGIIAGLLVGVTLFGLLRMSSDVIGAFENRGKNVVSERTEKFESTLEWMNKRGIQTENADGTMTLPFMLIIVMAFPPLILLRVFADYQNRYQMRWVGSRVVRDIRDHVFRNLQSQSLKYFGKCDIGKLISRCTNDTTVVEMVISSTVSDVTRAPVEILGALAFVGYFAVEQEMLGLVLGMALAFPLLIIPIVVLGRHVRRHSRYALERVSDLVSRMHENFTGVKVVKAFSMEERETEQFVGMSREYFRSIIKALRAELFMTPFMEGVAILIAVAILVVCFSREVRLSEIVPILLAGIVAYRPLKHLARIGANLQKGAAALGRIYEVLDIDTSLPEAAAPVKVKCFEKSIDFEDVSFRYDDDSDDVLSSISLSLRKGTVLALVGETGSGKTTIANLLARFYDPTRGRVVIDGVDLRDAAVSSLRSLMGVVTQETILFNDTIANNIAYGMDGASREQIVEAARRANAHHFIIADRAGYDRVVGEKGFVLSGGEKQRIAIARAILRDPPILILDEATSALDTITERLVQEAIAHVMEGRTVLAIAHRLSTVRHANQILLLDGGSIVERGTHDELYESRGRYRALCDMQVLDN